MTLLEFILMNKTEVMRVDFWLLRRFFSSSWVISSLTVMGLHVVLFVFILLWIWICNFIVSPYLRNLQPLFLQTLLPQPLGQKLPMLDLDIVLLVVPKRICLCFFFLLTFSWLNNCYWFVFRSTDFLHFHFAVKTNQWIFYFVYFSVLEFPFIIFISLPTFIIISSYFWHIIIIIIAAFKPLVPNFKIWWPLELVSIDCTFRKWVIFLCCLLVPIKLDCTLSIVKDAI